MNETKWAIQLESNAKFRVQKFREKSDVPTQWAKDLSVILKEKYSHSSICNYYNSIFSEQHMIVITLLLVVIIAVLLFVIKVLLFKCFELQDRLENIALQTEE